VEVKMFCIEREFWFDAAHRVLDYTGKCESLHGHTYKLILSITGDLKPDGMVLDFAIIKKIVEEQVIKELDHKFLNDIFENPTTELIAKWIYDKLSNEFEKFNCKIAEITLFEGHNSRVIIR
jgi:6-pyruvoyltetrahydropterin/6-carboxytetrahydropterin synthase